MTELVSIGEQLKSHIDNLWEALYHAYETGGNDLDKKENFKEFYDICHMIATGYNEDATPKRLIRS